VKAWECRQFKCHKAMSKYDNLTSATVISIRFENFWIVGKIFACKQVNVFISVSIADVVFVSLSVMYRT
jgi:hypothetical protein